MTPTRPEGADELAKTLTVTQATGLALSIVVGSGLLVLPGLAYAQAGGAAIYAWITDALLVVPLLVVFAYLGAHFPSAGGIAGFVQAAFSRRAGAVTELLLLGTFSLGIPAIAITGGYYFATATGSGRIGAYLGTMALLALAGVVNYPGARVSGRLGQVLAFALVGLLAGATALALLLGDRTVGAGVAGVESWPLAIGSLGLVFFAFTGWEMLSFTAEEYRRPKRDFPLAVGLSFVTVVGLYLAIAFAVQLTVAPGDPHLASAPIAAMLASTLGGPAGAAVSVLSVLIIAANLVGACWAASRLVFASAREGLLARRLSRLDPETRAPQAAVVTVVVVFGLIASVHFLGVVSLATLLGLAGQNFFILYGLSALAYLKLVRSRRAKAFGAAALALSVLVMGTFGWGLLYPAALMLAGAILLALRGGNHAPTRATLGASRV